jgi:uncharacterized protein YpmS
LEKKKKSKRKKLLIWLLVDILVAAIVIALLFHTPANYNPFVADETDADRVHPYLSHELMPQLYNGAQSRQPFEVVVSDQALNEAIAQAQWPQHAEGVTFDAPQVLFFPDRIVLMGTVNAEGAELVVTIEVGPHMDEEGLLSVGLQKIKVGAMNITPLAKTVARRMYLERLETVPVDTEDIRTKIAGALLNEEAFEPVFKVEDKWIRLKGLTLDEGQFVLRFVPAR